MLAQQGSRLLSGISWFLLKVGTRLIRFSAFLMHAFGSARGRPASGKRRIWIDVGAHRGETTFESARRDPNLLVYAFEPDVAVAAHRYGLLPNFVVLPLAVSDRDGFREFHVSSNDATSSLLAFDPERLKQWRGGGRIKTVRRVQVPTIRLDTFLDVMGIARVDYLKIDAQGHDLEVLLSLGDRIRDVAELKVEACAIARPLYHDAHNQTATVTEFLQRHGFVLAESLPESLAQERNLLFRRAPTCAQGAIS